MKNTSRFQKEMIVKRTPNRSKELLRFLPQEDKALFLSDLLEATSVSMENQNFDAITECLDDWEDAMELLSMPGLKDRAWGQFNKLKKAGCIS